MYALFDLTHRWNFRVRIIIIFIVVVIILGRGTAFSIAAFLCGSLRDYHTKEKMEDRTANISPSKYNVRSSFMLHSVGGL